MRILTDEQRAQLKEAVRQNPLPPDYSKRGSPGEKNPRAKLTLGEVWEIRSDLAGGAGVKATARKFGVSPPTVRSIRDRKTWAHIE